VPISHLPREVLLKKVGPRAVHQGVAAVVSAIPYADTDEVVRDAESDPRALLLALHRVEDPRNLGAILRTAAAAGVRGVLVGGEGMVGLTPTVAKTSAGALERIPVAREPSLAARLNRLKDAGFRVAALDPRGGDTWDAAELSGKLVVAVGGEAKGLPPKLLAIADARVAIPLAGGVESLNVSVAVGVLLFEVVRRRRGGSARKSNEFSMPRS
jgi:23S rRNA (guanosine2251-2'-O)-methyltransferase